MEHQESRRGDLVSEVECRKSRQVRHAEFVESISIKLSDIEEERRRDDSLETSMNELLRRLHIPSE